MTLTELQRNIASGATLQIELHALEQVLYMPYLRQGDDLQPLRDGRGQVLKYPNRERALIALARTGLEHADFVHRSPYGEMIGTDTENQNTELRERIDLASYNRP